MPFSSTAFKQEVKDHLLMVLKPNDKVLDVGAGSGTYGKMLAEHYTVDAIEIWGPYIDKYELTSIYNKVFNINILAFNFSEYDYIIMGDILEHIPAYEAMYLVDKMNNADKKILIAVPYLYEQGEYDGNVHEIHHQPDLTHEIFLKRYPSMHLLYKDDGYGYYINY